MSLASTLETQILLTGVSSDLGSVIAHRLSDDPSTLVVGTTRKTGTADGRFPDNVFVIENCDLTDLGDCERVAEVVSERFSGPFGFVHSVGHFWEHVPFEDFCPDAAASMLASHVSTLYNVLHFLVPVMKSKGGGSCVAFSCNSIGYYYPWMTAFTAAKAAVESTIATLANELAGDNIRLNALALSSIKSEKVHFSKPHGDFDHYIDPQDVVAVVRFFLSNSSKLISGQSIRLFEYSPRFFREGYYDRVSK